MDSNILAIIWYGSCARKDHRSDSDCDVCVFTRTNKPHGLDRAAILKLLNPSVNDIDISTYSLPLLNSMLNYGSLFLWHLKDEGHILYGKRFFERKLKYLEKFTDHGSQLLYYKEIFYDLIKSLSYIELPNEFDLSVLFTIVRNACLILSHKIGFTTFNKLNCFEVVSRHFSGVPLTSDEYRKLASW